MPSFARAQREVLIGTLRTPGSATVTLRIVAAPNLLQRLNGSEISLERNGLRYVSSPVRRDGPDGICTILDVPPGEYPLNLPGLRTQGRMAVRRGTVANASFQIGIGTTITIKELPGGA
jgi:hypothetical protein